MQLENLYSALSASPDFASWASFRAQDEAAWLQVWHALEYQPVAYAASTIDYQHAYLKGAAGWRLLDLSLVLWNDRKPCGIWPLTIGGIEELTASSQGTPVAGPLFVRDLSPRTIKKLTSKCLSWMLQELLPKAGQKVSCVDGIGPVAESFGRTEWYQQAMERGGHTRRLKNLLYLDLQPPMDAIRSCWRKSFRPLVTSASRLWTVHVMDKATLDPRVWENYRALHQDQAGRITRPQNTWDLQLLMIEKGEAILIFLNDTAAGNMVGGGYFQLTRDEGLYAVGAYNRRLFDKPLGHAVQARAIEEMKARGLRWYCIGERFYPGDSPQPSEKELSIAAFKEGFSSHLSALPIIAISISPEHQNQERRSLPDGGG